jgi:hypothetical protein
MPLMLYIFNIGILVDMKWFHCALFFFLFWWHWGLNSRLDTC